MKIIESKEKWEWHKKKLDAAAEYSHRHNGDPDRYPCMVKSDWWDDPNGPYTYDHSFIYEQEVKCDGCGSVKRVWPSVEAA